MLGHQRVRLATLAHLERSGATTLFVLSGSVGSGKTALVEWLRRSAGNRVVDVRAVVDEIDQTLQPDALNVRSVIHELTSALAGIGQTAALVYDDVDHDLLPDGVTRFVKEAVQALDMSFLVMTTRTPLPATPFPLPVSVFSLDHRATRPEEFRAFLDDVLVAAHASPTAFDVGVRDYLLDLEQKVPDFRPLAYILEMLIGIHRQVGRPVEAKDLYQVVQHDDHLQQFRSFPGVHVEGNQLSFRRKSKSELLADVLMRAYPAPSDLADMAAMRLEAFDQTGFLEEARASFRDAVMSMCLTRSPLDLVRDLLGPPAVLSEIKALQLERAQLFHHPDGPEHLLIRGLGFTLVDAPHGLSTFKGGIESASSVLANPGAGAELINGASYSIILHVEAALLDLLNFWGTYLFGSVAALVAEHNKRSAGRNVQLHKLSTGEIVGLLRFFDEVADEADQALRLLLVKRPKPCSAGFLRACDTFATRRNAFHHPAHVAPPASTDARRMCKELLASARDVIDRAGEGSYPAVIKLSEIIFDEYSRRTYTGVDADGDAVRFAFTDDRIDGPVVASHYYMLPARRVVVDPLLVPRSGFVPTTLFDQAEAYDSSSDTQRRQGAELLDRLSLEGAEQLLDVGCGSGALIVELARCVPDGHVTGIDVSPDMVRITAARVEAEGLNNVTVSAVGLLEYHLDVTFDVVFSNSVMHWILPPEKAYRRLFELLRPGGSVAVHQGGKNSYRGLWECAAQVVENKGLGVYFTNNWSYPAYYPTKEELQALLEATGFCDVVVTSRESEGVEFPNLVVDFANAGLLPFVRQLPEIERDGFRTAFLHRAREVPPSLYTHRLYAAATKPT